MKKLTVTTTQKVHVHSLTAPRIFSWVVALGGIPFTSGASLLMLPITELGYRAERKAAAAEASAQALHVMPQVRSGLEDLIRGGKKSATCAVLTHTDRAGDVDLIFKYKVRSR